MSFTPEAQKIIDELKAVRYEGSCNKEAIEMLMTAFYRELGVAMPPIVWAKDFEDAIKIIHERDAARRAARDAAWRAAWDAARDADWRAARDAAWDAARDAAWDAARRAARDAAWRAAWDAARRAARRAAWDADWDAARDAARGAAWDAARGAAWDAAYVNTGLKDPAVIKEIALDNLAKDAFIAGLGYYLPMNNFLILIPNPILRIENNRLHSVSSPSVEWASGKKFWHIYGVKFDEKEWEGITGKTTTIPEILKIKDIDKRTAALMFRGAEELFEALKPKKIDECAVMRADGILSYELYEVEGLTDQTEKMLRYRCASFDRTGKSYVKFVEPKYISALAAIAESHHVTPEQYKLITNQA